MCEWRLHSIWEERDRINGGQCVRVSLRSQTEGSAERNTLATRLAAQNPLVSLVSALGRNWCYLCGIVEGVEESEIVEIANIHAF
jgi:hypothetical protein